MSSVARMRRRRSALSGNSPGAGRMRPHSGSSAGSTLGGVPSTALRPRRGSLSVLSGRSGRRTSFAPAGARREASSELLEVKSTVVPAKPSRAATYRWRGLVGSPVPSSSSGASSEAESVRGAEAPVPSERLFIGNALKRKSKPAATKNHTGKLEVGVSAQMLEDPPEGAKVFGLGVLYIRKEGGKKWDWLEMRRTDVVPWDASGFSFGRAFSIEFDRLANRDLKLVLYRAEDEDAFVLNLDAIGSATFDMFRIRSHIDRTLELELVTEPASDPSSHVIGTLKIEPVVMRTYARIHLAASEMMKCNYYGTSDPFYIIYRYDTEFFNDPSNAHKAEEEAYVPVYRSEAIKNTLDPTWKPATLSLKRLCQSSFHLPLIVRCFDWDSDQTHQPMGEAQTSLLQLYHDGAASGDPSLPHPEPMELIQPQLKLQKEYDNSGLLHVLKVELFGEIDWTNDIPTVLDDELGSEASLYKPRSIASRTRSRRSARGSKFTTPVSDFRYRKSRRSVVNLNRMDGATVDTSMGGTTIASDSRAESLQGHEIPDNVVDSVQRLVDRLSLSDQRAVALMELRVLCFAADSMRELFVDLGGLVPLMTLMGPGHTAAVQEAACWLLKNLAASEVVRNAFRIVGGLPHLVALLGHSPGRDALVQALWCVHNLVHDNDQNRDMLRLFGLFPALVPLLDHDDDGVRENAALCLSACTEGAAANRVAAAALGAIGKLIAMLDADVHPQATRVAAIAALGNMAYGNTANCVQIRTDGGLERLIEYLTRRDDHEDLHEYCLWTLCALTYDDPEACEYIRESEGLRRIINLFASGAPGIQQYATICIMNLTRGNDKNKLAVRDLNGILPVLNLLQKQYSDSQSVVDGHDELRAGALGVLRNLGTLPQNRAFIDRLIRLMGIEKTHEVPAEPQGRAELLRRQHRAGV